MSAFISSEAAQMYIDLTEAAKAGNVAAFQRIERMLKDEFDISWNDNEHGTTYLIWASFHGHMNFVSYLVEKGAIVDKKNKYGSTALSYALQGKHVDVARLLLERGADPNIKPYDTKNATFLLFGNVQPYDTTNHDFPLCFAAQENQPEACELLLSFGANLDQKTANGWTSLDVAIQLKHTKGIKVLQTAIDKKKEEKRKEEKRKEIIANIAKAAKARNTEVPSICSASN